MSDPKIVDITPWHNPVLLAEVMSKLAEDPECITGFFMLVYKDGTMEKEGCAERKKDLLWALELLKLELLADP